MVKPLSAETKARLALPSGSTLPAIIDPTLSLGEILLVHAYILRRDGIAPLAMNAAASQTGPLSSTTAANGDAKRLHKRRSSVGQRLGGSVDV